MKILNKVLLSTTFLLSLNISAAVLTTDNITVTFDDDTGAISSFIGFGTDYFNPGTSVSNYGFAIDGDANTFSLAATTGSFSNLNLLSFTDATEGVNSYTANGTFGTFGEFTRTFDVVDDLDVLSITTTYTNTSASDYTLLQFETFDPDQGQSLGLGFGTANDVVSIDGLDGLAVATATNTAGNNPFFLASPFATATESGGIFQIANNSDLLDVLNSPFDANGAIADTGSHIAISNFIAASETVSFTTFIGTTSDDLASAFGVLTDVLTVNEVPTPSSTILFVIAIAGLTLRKVTNKV